MPGLARYFFFNHGKSASEPVQVAGMLHRRGGKPTAEQQGQDGAGQCPWGGARYFFCLATARP